MGDVKGILPIRKCDECGKEFIPGAEHLYTMKLFNKKKKWYCSYTCWRKNGGDNRKWRKF